MTTFNQMHNDYLDPDLHGDCDCCEICGQDTMKCDCPICEACGEQGNPDSYTGNHPLAFRPDSIHSFCLNAGISPIGTLLRAIDRHNTEAVDIMVIGRDGWITPSDTDVLDDLQPWQVLNALRVRGIAWDGSDWEWGKTVFPGTGDEVWDAYWAAREEFTDALSEYLASKGPEGQDLSAMNSYSHEEDGITYLRDVSGDYWGAPEFMDGTVEVDMMLNIVDFDIGTPERLELVKILNEKIPEMSPLNQGEENQIRGANPETEAIFLYPVENDGTGVAVLTSEPRGDGGDLPWLKFVGYLEELRREWKTVSREITISMTVAEKHSEDLREWMEDWADGLFAQLDTYDRDGLNVTECNLNGRVFEAVVQNVEVT
jgi:hypothetical protein